MNISSSIKGLHNFLKYGFPEPTSNDLWRYFCDVTEATHKTTTKKIYTKPPSRDARETIAVNRDLDPKLFDFVGAGVG